MFQPTKSDSGFVMVLVILTVAIMSLVVVGLLSRSVSKTLTGEEQIRRMQAEEISKGAFWQAYANLAAGGTVSDYNQVVDGRTYRVDLTVSSPNLDGTNNVTVNVVY